MVTNSKGEKVEVYLNSYVHDDMSLVYTGNNPTEEMKKNALEHGLDLDDPMIRAELNKLKEKEIRKQSQNKTTKIPKKEVPNTQEDILENSKNFSYKWWIIGIIVIFTGIYFYSPAEKELW